MDKNEDQLRRFKHDYQNILNSLKLSAQKGDVKAVIKQLDQYTHSHFDQRALRKYKGVNHVHVEALKSILIAKLERAYNKKINYSFGCKKNIDHIPSQIDILDLVRIIGIAFDNAIEESEALIKASGNVDSAKIDIMFYQENGDFEFEIKNRLLNSNLDIRKMKEKHYTTKKHHAGMGLANVEELAHKYEDSMLTFYRIEDGNFIFSMTLLPNDGSEN